MLICIDDANIEKIKKIYELYPVDGVSTNPSILAKTGRPPYEVLKEIRQIIGDEGELFVQDLSFFGWVILSLLTGSLGLVFLTPYYQGAKTHAYAYLKEQALSTGTLKASDFTDLN